MVGERGGEPNRRRSTGLFVAYYGLFPAYCGQFVHHVEEGPMAKVFMSYSHADEEMRNGLEKHFAGLRHQGVITVWHDRRIGPGEELHEQISTELQTANIVLLLVRPISSVPSIATKLKCNRHWNGTTVVTQ